KQKPRQIALPGPQSATDNVPRFAFRVQLSHTLKNGGDTLTQTDAHSGHADGAAILLHHVQQGAGDPRTGAAEGVTQGDGAAVEVDLLVHLVHKLEFLEHWQRLCDKGIVQRDVVYIVHGQTGTLERLLGGRNRTVAHDGRIATGHR